MTVLPQPKAPGMAVVPPCTHLDRRRVIHTRKANSSLCVLYTHYNYDHSHRIVVVRSSIRGALRCVLLLSLTNTNIQLENFGGKRLRDCVLFRVRVYIITLCKIVLTGRVRRALSVQSGEGSWLLASPPLASSDALATPTHTTCRNTEGSQVEK